MTLAEIIKKIARRHCMPDAVAGGFILDSIEEIIRAVDSGEDVKIRGLGTFRWRKSKGRPGSGAYSGPIPDGWKLHFLPSRRFRARRTKMSDSDGMTKYGVQLDDEKTKQASEKAGEASRCPTCSRKLDDAGSCPVHGTEPLEPADNNPKR